MPDFDVAIVGYGPVGAMGAYLLADAGLRVARVEKAGHFLHQEKPDEVNGILLDWLRRDATAGVSSPTG